MVTLFYILLFLAIWHFFYESILAPSLRHGLRYRFFSLRDKLRSTKIDNNLSKKDQEIYEILDNTICNMINSMSFISIGNYLMLKKEIEKNKKVKTEINKVKDFIENTSNVDLKLINSEISSIGESALLINNGGWFVYLILPLFIVAVFALFSIQFDKLHSKISKVSNKLIYSSGSLNNNSNFRVA